MLFTSDVLFSSHHFSLLMLFSHTVVSNSLWPHGLQHIRLLYSSLSPRVCSNSCLLSQWCHPTISSSASPFFSCPQYFPELGSFTMSWLFSSGGQNIGTSASASVLPMNIQGWFPLGLTVWSPCSPRDSQESYPEPQFESISSLALSLLYVQLSHPYILVTQLCLTIDCSPLASSVHRIFQARLLEWVVIFFSRGSSQPRDRTCISCIAGRFFNAWATREVHNHTWILGKP